MNKLRARQNQDMYNRQQYNNQPGAGADGRNFQSNFIVKKFVNGSFDGIFN